MSKFTLTIIVLLAIALTTMVYTMSNSIEIKALITLMDIPIIILMASNMDAEK